MNASLVSADSQRTKFQYLLHLAKEQIRVLKLEDSEAFDRILAAKQALIDGFPDAARQVAADPALARMCQEIQDCDAHALRLLYGNMGKVMRQLSEIRKSEKARKAYGASTPAPGFPGANTGNNARFIDRLK